MRRLLARGLAAALILVVVWLGWVMWQIHRQSSIDEARAADVIIVLGAAEYRGRPSPVLRARLDHALQIMIGENFLGQITARSNDSGVLHTGLSSANDWV